MQGSPDNLHHEALLTAWGTLGTHLKAASAAAWQREGRRLLRSWSRWPRAYHNCAHLRACLYHLQSTTAPLEDPHAVELALWFHDAIYWPWSHHNEERSAVWAQRFLQQQGLPAQRVATVVQHILDTKHTPGPLTGDALWVVDIDLAILGQEDAVYRQFERNVRKEYFFVRWPRYVAGRSTVLQGFLDRPRIYQTDFFAQRFEAQARINLRHALQALREGKLYT